MAKICGILNLLFLYRLLSLQSSFSQTDIPCFLSTGTSRESFTANELLPIGSVIGVLNIYGDPSENGTIQLSLSEDDAPVELEEGTKNLILKKRLDKEGIEGPAEVSLQVYCRKRGSDELSFPIPLRIFVGDANDNAPEFVDIPDRLEISEMTQPGSVVTPHPIRAIDKDQTGPYSTVQYSLEPGPYSDHFTFPNALKGVLTLKLPVDYETTPAFNITVKAQDLGNPPLSAIRTIPVSVLDADDLNPKFRDERYTAVLPDDPKPGYMLDIKPRSIRAQDMDQGINSSVQYSFKSDQVDGKYFSIDSSTGQVKLRQPLPEDTVFPLTLVIKASQKDNRERVALTTLTVSQRTTFLTGLRFLQNDYIISVPENLPLNQTVLLVQTNKLDDKRLRFSIDENDHFTVTDRGEIILKKPLDYEKFRHLKFQVNVSDGKLSDSTRVNVEVVDVNNHSPEFGSRLYNFVVLDGILVPGMTLGQVDAHDGDSNDVITYSLAGDAASSFSIDEQGVIQIVNVSQLNSSLTHLIVTATDNGQPPRHSSVPIIVTVPDEIRLSSIQAFNADSSCLLMIIFGAMLGLLIIIILVLALYIAKLKSPQESRLKTHPATQSMSKMASFVTSDIPHQKLTKGSPSTESHLSMGLENPIFMEDGIPPAASTSSKTSKDVQLCNGKTTSTATTLKMSPSKANPKLDAIIPCFPRIDPSSLKNVNPNKTKDISNSETSSTSNQNGSIPRRVKKLSWEDEKLEKCELESVASVTMSPEPTNDEPKTGDIGDNAIFF